MFNGAMEVINLTGNTNTYLSNETTKEDVLRGYNLVKKASLELNIPIIAFNVDENLLNDINST